MTPEEKRAKNAAKMRAYRAKHPEAWAALQKRSRDRNLERRRQDCRDWHVKNRDRVLERRRAPDNKAKEAAAFEAWRQANKPARAEYQRLRVAGTRTKIALFYKADTAAIYAECGRRRAAGEDASVDHVIPLKGDGVCGLHVPWNLAIIPRPANLAKRNAMPPESEWLGAVT